MSKPRWSNSVWRKTVLILLTSLVFSGEEADLNVPFGGFDEAGLKPVYALFDADPEGRVLLRAARRKLGLPNRKALAGVFSFCDAAELGGDRQGLYIYQVEHLYRPQEESEWRELTPGTLAKIKDPSTYPIMEEHSHYTLWFEHREVVFLPRICIAPGLTVMQAYLVLFHELTHLANIEPFDHLDLFSFSESEREQKYYFKELSRSGGELDAHLAQLAALKRLRSKWGIVGENVLEQFLNEKGFLDYQDRPAFLRRLLNHGGYGEMLDYQLKARVVNEYNMAQVWWDFFQSNMDILEKNTAILEEALASANALRAQALQDGANPQRLDEQIEEMEQRRHKARQLFQVYSAERDERIKLMERLDARFPEEP